MKNKFLLLCLSVFGVVSCGQVNSTAPSHTTNPTTIAPTSNPTTIIPTTSTPLSNPVITISVNGKEVTNGSAGTFTTAAIPTFSYTVSPSNLVSSYIFLKDGQNIGKSTPSEVGDYVYKVDVQGGNGYLAASKTVTFKIEQAVADTDSKLNNYKISYLSSSLNDEDAASVELRKSLNNLGYNLEIEALDIYSNANKNIYLDVNDNLPANTYKVSKDNNSILLTSDTDVGLYEACRTFLAKVISDDVAKMGEWFLPASEGTYTKAEPVKIMSYNVRVGNDGTLHNGDSGNISDRAPRVIKGIQNYYPDVLGIQEANDTWVSKLKDGLMPQYGYTGWGRESNLLGESSGIFYNRDTVTLLETATKWLSDTPDVPGTRFANAGNYNRILTYGIFERKSDGLIFMHINTHLDLTAAARILDAEVIQDYASKFNKNMPIFVTGDMNNQRKNLDDGTSYLINTYGYKDAADLDKTADRVATYPQEGYYGPTDDQTGYDPGTSGYIIDYVLFANDGFTVDKYEVDTNKYSGDGIEKPQLTSDHYPLYVEATPYAPLKAFNEYSHGEGDVAIDNTFVQYDHSFNLVKENSQYDNYITCLASKSEHNGQIKTSSVSHTKYECVGNLSGSGKYVKYTFESDSATKGDLALVISSSNYGTAQSPSNNYITENLGQYVDLTINGKPVDIANIDLRNNDIKEWYDWEVLKLLNVDIVEGVNTVQISCKGSVCPNVLLMEVFTGANVDSDSTLEFSETPSRYDETYHYYASLKNPGEEKAELHTESIVENVVAPTTTATGLTEKLECSVCHYVMKEATELPVLNNNDYNTDVVTKYVDGVGVCDTIVYTLKDTSKGHYEFTIVTNPISEYIHAGTSYYSIDRWNQIFANQTAVVTTNDDGVNLTITLKDGETTVVTASDGVSPLDGILDLTLYNSVTVKGKGTLEISYSTLQDGINANTFIVEEGATVNLTGASNQNKSGIKVYKDFVVNGTMSITNFGYGQAISYENNNPEKIRTMIGENGSLSITNCKNGIYAWNDAWHNKPQIINEGKLTIRVSGDGMNFNDADVNVYFRGNSETYISSGNLGIGEFNGLYVGNGEKGLTQNNAKLTVISSGGNVIFSRNYSTAGIEMVFNSSNTILIECTNGLNDKCGIQAATAYLKLFQISCVDMTIKGMNHAIGTWRNQSVTATYNYEAPNSKINIVDCKYIQNSNDGKTFACFNEDTVNRS